MKIIIALTAVVLLGVGIVWYFNNQKDNVQPLSSEIIESSGGVNVRQPAGFDRSETPKNLNCLSKECFEQLFTGCEPGGKATFSIEDFGVTYYYEIIGPQSANCAVKSKFLQNPNSTWVGKEMVCNYDNKLALNSALESVVSSFNSPNEKGNC